MTTDEDRTTPSRHPTFVRSCQPSPHAAVAVEKCRQQTGFRRITRTAAGSPPHRCRERRAAGSRSGSCPCNPCQSCPMLLHGRGPVGGCASAFDRMNRMGQDERRRGEHQVAPPYPLSSCPSRSSCPDAVHSSHATRQPAPITTTAPSASHGTPVHQMLKSSTPSYGMGCGPRAATRCDACVTTLPGGTECVSQTLPPITLPAPITVRPPRMVALA